MRTHTVDAMTDNPPVVATPAAAHLRLLAALLSRCAPGDPHRAYEQLRAACGDAAADQLKLYGLGPEWLTWAELTERHPLLTRQADWHRLFRWTTVGKLRQCLSTLCDGDLREHFGRGNGSVDRLVSLAYERAAAAVPTSAAPVPPPATASPTVAQTPANTNTGARS